MLDETKFEIEEIAHFGKNLLFVVILNAWLFFLLLIVNWEDVNSLWEYAIFVVAALLPITIKSIRPPHNISYVIVSTEKVTVVFRGKEFAFDKDNIDKLIFVHMYSIKYYENGKVAFDISVFGEIQKNIIKSIEEKMGVKVTIK